MDSSRRTFLKQLGFAALCLAAAPQAAAKQLSDLGRRRIAILHTNDVHSRIDPFPTDAPRYANLGGYARRKAYIDSVRNQGIETLVFESGDMFQGTPYFNLYKGELEINLMNKMGIDAVTIGNHEFDNGLDVLCDRMEQARFPFVNCNYTFKSARAAAIVKPYTIFERCGIKIGVFGLGVKIDGLIDEAMAAGTVYNDPVECACRTSARLRQLGCRVVIALSHLGYQMQNQPGDVAVAKASTDIDIILGGHTHTFLSEPVVVNNANGKAVIVNQVGYGGVNVGRIDIVLDGGDISLCPRSVKVMG